MYNHWTEITAFSIIPWVTVNGMTDLAENKIGDDIRYNFIVRFL